MDNSFIVNNIDKLGDVYYDPEVDQFMSIDDYVAHHGTPHDGFTPHSGRYPWGSGVDSYQGAVDFRSSVAQLKKSGAFKSNTELARALGLTTSQYRAYISRSKDEVTKHNIALVQKYKEKGMSDRAVAEKMGLSGESQVRSYLKQAESGRANKTKEVSEILKQQVDQKKYLDVGSGVENQLGISSDKLKVACSMLEPDGYHVESIKVPQVTNPKQFTNMRVLVKDGVDKHDVWENRDKIEAVTGVYTEDNKRTIRNIEPPVQVDPKRVMVKYAEDGGVERDGEIRLRRGVQDLSMGQANYCQVRIDVNGTHYLKGMAVYGEDGEFPKGVDIIFNTNKHKGTPMMGPKNNTVLKPLKDDPDNPFGATIKPEEDLIRAQRHYKGKDGKEHLSALNIVNEEGNWGDWKKTVASQMLSKQPVETAKKQLKIASDTSKLELQDINACTNNVVKKKLLEDYASAADEAAVDLKAAKFPRQASHVILPINSLKENEIYAPNYKDGEQVVCVRYPYGGKFEMPVLTVNNRNKEGKTTITPNAIDAVGINHKVAEQLSGADFDGDTVLVIPTKGQKIATRKACKDLVDFDPSSAYPAYDGMPEVGPKTGFQKQKQMGIVSNLITDMTIKGADMSEIERAVKHSMVVIDAEKHNLNWRQSEKDFGIDQLKRKYQYKGKDENGKDRYGGASTLISRAKGEYRIPEIKENYGLSPRTIDPKTGRLIRQETGGAYDKGNGKSIHIGEDGKTYTYGGKDGNGKTIWEPYTPVGKVARKETVVTNMEAYDDANKLSSGSKMENVYADYANTMKGLANEARKSWLNTPDPKRDPVAAKTYAKEVESLQRKLDIAKANAPKERQAQLIASKYVEMQIKANPDKYSGNDNKESIKKLRNQALKGARNRTGASKSEVVFTDREWEAVQHNAISATKLRDLLNNADMDVVRKLATPKNNKALSSAKISRAKALARNGYTNAEIADALGISATTVSNYLAA